MFIFSLKDDCKKIKKISTCIVFLLLICALYVLFSSALFDINQINSKDSYLTTIASSMAMAHASQTGFMLFASPIKIIAFVYLCFYFIGTFNIGILISSFFINIKKYEKKNDIFIYYLASFFLAYSFISLLNRLVTLFFPVKQSIALIVLIIISLNVYSIFKFRKNVSFVMTYLPFVAILFILFFIHQIQYGSCHVTGDATSLAF